MERCARGRSIRALPSDDPGIIDRQIPHSRPSGRKLSLTVPPNFWVNLQQSRAEPLVFRRRDSGSVALAPGDLNQPRPVCGPPQGSADGDVALRHGQGAVLGRVGSQFVEGQVEHPRHPRPAAAAAHATPRARTGATARRERALYDFGQRSAFPAAARQQSCERVSAISRLSSASCTALGTLARLRVWLATILAFSPLRSTLSCPTNLFARSLSCRLPPRTAAAFRTKAAKTKAAKRRGRLGLQPQARAHSLWPRPDDSN